MREVCCRISCPLAVCLLIGRKGIMGVEKEGEGAREREREGNVSGGLI
jgi:hypothetical protein